MKSRPKAPADADIPIGFDPDALEPLRKAYEAGVKSALIQAICICFMFEEVAPQWIVTAFLRAAGKWQFGEVKELGEALGLSWPKGASLYALRKRRRSRLDVYLAIEKAKKNGRAINEEFFIEIGQRFGISKTLVKEYYKSARDKGYKYLVD